MTAPISKLKCIILTKTDDILLALNRTAAKYIRELPTFQYLNKTYRLINNYVAVPYMKCDACGNYPIYEVSVVESENGKTLCLGNNCIDNLTGQSVSEWFRRFRRERESAMENRENVDQQSLIP